MKMRTEKSIYDKLLVGALLLIASEILAPVPLAGPLIEMLGIVL